jgi:hypothetical protein
MQLLLLLAVLALDFAVSDPISIQRETAKFDDFGDVCCNAEKARLDNYAVALQNLPEARGFIIFYGGRRQSYPFCSSSRQRLPRRGEAQARAARLRPYVLRGWPTLDPQRVVVIDGGYRETWSAELWIVPKGGTVPKPTPTLKVQNIRFRRGKAHKRDYHCEV